jgi:hypothetical protein
MRTTKGENMNFITFKQAVQKQFQTMQATGLFDVDVGDADLNEAYLKAFPNESNPVFRERTEHDCSCCKQFIRKMGGVVTIVENKLVSIWDISIPSEPAYQVVADALSALVKSKAVSNKFMHYENHVGTDKNFEATVSGATTWEHFYVNLPSKFVFNKDKIGTLQGEAKAAFDVTIRGLKEITVDAIDTVLELIAQNSLYRGEEHKANVVSFKKLKAEFDKAENKELFVWQYIDGSAHAGRIRNTVIGSLLTDLSDGEDLEKSVKSFEQKVAPTNYKRPTALVTQKMIDAAKETIEALGYTSALVRRYATLDDISINNVLFANRAVKKQLTGSVLDDLKPTAKTKQKEMSGVEEISIEKFLKDVLPTATSVELMLENSHKNNFVSLIAPVDITAPNMFKWSNKYSWSYAGDFTDSIKERVKAAGGEVDAELCCRLSWFNYDDLDIHLKEPTGTTISFRNRSSTSGGMLDVDMNACSGKSRTPVENIFYKTVKNMREGEYSLYVNNFNKRESMDVGFVAEIDYKGNVTTFEYPKAVGDSANVAVAKFTYSKKDGVVITSSIPNSTTSKTIWGVDTNKFVPVKSVMLSPNFWDEQETGNKHYFFMLEGCKNEDVARGFYNEFLSPELDKHRKVLEMVGSKLKTVTDESQLSGVGFSSTQKNSVVCRVNGSFTRVLKIVF